ncbi:S-adenosyl-L-methionine-dependent methyltransferase [Arabidopsis suecica]|uniref:S-adenosyl-L-methionine-dependent methyltransferase n=1 Tax=Arabidopsis suecica TaxID=45249 RepID=A0A8T2F7Q7_ARASU|nr:S-adenosyl-L-methionine-dependent methyltransferase [Arabidopsis suecica]KAG7631579.1 S-adenosyl-L-methionine-dependent methyltransferase [Arabidopsis suecica]
MADMRRRNGSGGSSNHERNEQILFPKPETLDFDLPCDTSYPQQIGDNAASSSGSNVKSLLIEMGFCPTLVQKAIDENGQDDFELLLEILSKSTETEPPGPSFHGLMEPKPEPDIEYETDRIRIALLTMKFPENLVDFALDRLGKDTPIDEMVDFIVAAQLAEKYAEESEDSLDGAEINEEDEDVTPVTARGPEVPNEQLFETMDKTLRLLEMGFSNDEISMAIEKIGTKGQISVLAESIVTGEFPAECHDDLEDIEKKVSAAAPAVNRTCLSKSWRFVGVGAQKEDGGGGSSSGTANIKPDPDIESFPFPATDNVGETSRGKRPKDEDENAYPEEYTGYDDRGKRLRPEDMGDSSSFMETPWMQDEWKDNTYEFPSVMQPRLSQSLGPKVARRPYFFYGQLGELSPSWWSKISGFLFGIHPEHVDTRLCSALRRTEGYLHNLPTVNRFNTLPNPRLTIQDAMPHMRSWWPQWDIRKHFNSGTCSNMKDATLLCERIGRRIAECKGKPTQQDQTLILRHCHTSNLIWIAPNILSPLEPEHLECIMGYPMNHTNIGGGRLAERLKLFDYCFQTDTLGYHLSVLKSMFPQGLTVLSLFSGIGGAEIALDRLGIHLKGVVSVESCGLSRNILKRWWQTSGQTGELVQIEEIKSLTAKRLETLMQRFGGFDFVICQNPSTPLDLSKEISNSEACEFDYTLFNEFARVTKRVRDMM